MYVSQQVLAKLEEMRSCVRDPYFRQTRLTLTQMIKKQAAENKRLMAELKAAQVSTSVCVCVCVCVCVY